MKFNKQIQRVDDIFHDYNPDLIHEKEIKDVELNSEGLHYKEENFFNYKRKGNQIPKSVFTITQGFSIKGSFYCIIAKKTVYSHVFKRYSQYIGFVEVAYLDEKSWDATNRRYNNTEKFFRKEKPNIVTVSENELLNKIADNLDTFRWISCD